MSGGGPDGVDERRTRAFRIAAWSVVVAGAVVIGAYFRLPDPRLQDVAFMLVALTGVALAALGVRSNRSPGPTPWPWWVAGLAAFAAANVSFWFEQQVLGRSPTFPSTTDAFELLHIAFVFVGVVVAVRRRRGRDREGWVDVAIVAVALAAGVWETLGHLEATGPLSLLDRLAIAGYATGAAVLLVVAVRLLVEPRGRGAARWLVVGALTAMLVGLPAFATLSVTGEYRTGHPIDAALLAVPILWAAAALHPASQLLVSRRAVRAPRSPRRRAIGLGVVLVIVTAAFVVEDLALHPGHSHAAILVPMSVVALLVVVRMAVTERRADVLRTELLRTQQLHDLGRLAGSIGHDFNNLLTVVLGFGELLRSRIEDRPDAVAELDEMIRAAEEAAQLTDQLVVFTNWRADAAEVVDAGRFLLSIGGFLQRLAGDGIEVRVAPAAEPLPVRVSPARATRVLANLVANARDAIDGTGTVTVGATRDGAMVVVTVADDGHGMEPYVAERALEPFFTTGPPGERLGLGLPAAQRLVHAAGGELLIESEPGVGTTVAIRLPPATASTDEARRSPGADAGAVVVVVEDAGSVRRFIETTLERHGSTVHAVATVDEARELLDRAELEVDLLVVDVGALGGRTDLLPAEGAAPPVVFTSGRSPDDVDLPVGAGRSAFLAKPFTASDLLDAVDGLLGR